MTTALLGGVLALFLSGLGTLEEGQAAQTVQRAWLHYPALEGRRWRVVSYDDGAGLVSPELTAQDPLAARGTMMSIPSPSIEFAAGKLRGSPGCGALVGSYTLSGNQITIMGAGVIVGGWCPRNLEDQNRHLVAALDGEWTVDGPVDQAIPGMITFRDHTGSIIQFELAP